MLVSPKKMAPRSLNPTDNLEISTPTILVGADEVGAGCLAGPLVAAAYACLIPEVTHEELDAVRVFDSKALSEKVRRKSFEFLRKDTDFQISALVEVQPEKIDEINIYQARMFALSQSVKKVISLWEQKLKNRKLQICIDGPVVPKGLSEFGDQVIAQSKGDQKFFSVAAASIIAKEHRDNLMEQLSESFPFYSWDSNVGYPTVQHKEALHKHGLSPWHRKSFCRFMENSSDSG